nr:Cation H+ exchanger domain containing protein [Haemonchus contortus]
MGTPTECSQLVIEPSVQSERRWKLPVIYTAEVSSCCAYLLFVVLAFVTCNSVIETSMQNKSLSDALAVPKSADYALSIYSLVVIVSLGVVIGYITQLCRLPSLLGMLVVGIALRNEPAISEHLFVVKEWSVVLRRIAFVVILLRGGLSLDVDAIRRLKGACVRLALVPCSVETVVVAVAAKLIFGMDIIFGVLLGAVLAAVSLAVVIPALLDASKAGYGVRVGVPSLVIAAASLDDVYAISIFSLALSLLFSSGTNMEMTILAAPVEVFSGIFFGSAMVLGIGLFFRFIASILAVFVTNLTIRERLFVAVAWMPKATVQAALAPVVLDMARSKDGVDRTYVDNGIVIFTVAVLSILITAPVGAFLIRLATPLLLTKDENSGKFTADGENELENGMNESAENTL